MQAEAIKHYYDSNYIPWDKNILSVWSGKLQIPHLARKLSVTWTTQLLIG